MDIGHGKITSGKTHTAAYYLLEALNEVGIEYLFCNLGTDHAPIIEEVARWKGSNRALPKIVLCPHENVAVHMAAGYALKTGRGQGVLVHVDAGTANAAIGLHNLQRARIPVMLMAGVAPFTSFGELTGSRDTYVHFIQQPFDQASIVRPYLKWEYTLPSGVVAKETVRRAYTLMQSEPKGPVYLMLPREVLAAECEEAAVRSYSADRFGALDASGADPALVEQLADRLLGAKNPMLITSYAGRDPAASDAIAALATFAGIRVVDFLSVNNISWEFPGFGGHQPNGLADVDVGLLVDVEVPWLPLSMKDNPSTFWAQIDIDVLKSASPMWTFPSNLRLQGRSARILEQLLSVLRERASPTFSAAAADRLSTLTQAQSVRRAEHARLASDRGMIGQINPHFVCAELSRVLAADDIVVNEAVTRQAVAMMQVSRPKPGTMIANSGGGLGASGGLALGIKLACPSANVVQIVGDGTFYFNNPSAMFATAKQYGLPIFTVILDNAGWSAVKQSVQRVYPTGLAQHRNEFQALLAPEMDFSKIVEAAGGYGERVVDPDEVAPAIARCMAALQQGRSALVHMCVTKL